MICTVCQHENPPGNAFCGGCGAKLQPVCPQCGHASSSAEAFCGKCGGRIGPPTAAADQAPTAAELETGERRQLTVLFCDLVGSTELAARLDAEDYSEALHAYHARADAVIARYGGYVAQHLGDGLLVYFGWPRTYDDAAERAVRAGLGLVEATATVQAGGAPLAARVGLHTGTVVVSEVGTGMHHETLALGDTPNVAARVQAAAEPQQVVITAATQRLVVGRFIVEARGAHALKGVPQPVDLYRVIRPSGVRDRLDAAAAGGLTPFVDRDEARARLRGRFERVCDGEGQVVLLVGEGGIGKSRLARQLRVELAETPYTWLETGGSPHFANTPFYAVTELLKQVFAWEPTAPPQECAERVARALEAAGLELAETLPLVAPLLDLPLPASYHPFVGAPEIARRRLLTTLQAWLFGLARRQPLVLLLEDLHWVDPSTLELAQLLAEQGSREPLLLVGTARPEFQVPWAPRAHYTTLQIGRLSKRHVQAMVAGVAAHSEVVAGLVESIAARTDGVPLFVEELTKVMVEAGVAASAHEIPATLADSLMARLDRLGPAAKEVAQVGAVCGREFSYELLQAVHPRPAEELEAALAKLQDAELVYALGLPPAATYTFKHALVQDTAYESLLKSRRRGLHAALATALTEHFGALAAEHPELLAHHLTEGLQLEPAAAAWQRAGDRALERGASREAEHYMRRGLDALSGLPEGEARDHAEFLLQAALGKTLVSTRGYGAPETAAAFARGREIGERVGSPDQLAFLVTGLAAATLHDTGPETARPLAEQAVALAERANQAPLLTLAYLVLGTTTYNLCELTMAREQLTRALTLYDEETAIVLPIDARCAIRGCLAFTLWHLGFADLARAHIRQTLERGENSAAGRALAGHQSAAFAALLRDPAETLRLAVQVLTACAEEPNPAHEATAMALRGWALSHVDGSCDGPALVREGMEALVATGQRINREECHILLADTLALRGNLDEALCVLAEGELTCPDQLIHRPGTLWRRADLLARQGAPPAEVEAAFAVALDFMREHGTRSYELRTATSYGRWLGAQRRQTEARELVAPLYATFTEGFATRDLIEARQLLEELGAGGAGTAADAAVVAAAGGGR
jgi:class 3 adenylate cyclase